MRKKSRGKNDDQGNSVNGQEVQGKVAHTMQALRLALIPRQDRHMLQLRLRQERPPAKLHLAEEKDGQVIFYFVVQHF
jgi:hypothetical protein